MRILKKIFFAIFAIALIFSLAVSLFVNFYPSFGGEPSAQDQELYKKIAFFKEGKFYNPEPTQMGFSFSNIQKLIKEYSRDDVQRAPKVPPTVHQIDSINIANYSDTLPRITWFGHSAFLLEVGTKKILLDPMLGESPAPHPLLGTKRFYEQLPIAIEKLPKIDAVVFSHDHYDHLDYESVLKLKEKTAAFLVPLGVDAHLEAWGVEHGKIKSLNWWDSTDVANIKFICTPARHFSGRGILNRESTLWASWILKIDGYKFYFSGDGGYGQHFKEIGSKYGPFDFAMMECGQYNEMWADIHMMPEETVQASLDLDAKLAMPIHWGAFTLALHSWTDPIERFSKKARDVQLPFIAPEIGEVVYLNTYPQVNAWWKKN